MWLAVLPITRGRATIPSIPLLELLNFRCFLSNQRDCESARKRGLPEVSIAAKHWIAACLGLVLALAGGADGCLRPLSAQGAPGGDDLAFWEELAFWETVKDSRDAAEFKAYLDTYPNGRFVRLAKVRIKALEREGGAARSNEEPVAAIGSKGNPREPQASSTDDAQARGAGGGAENEGESDRPQGRTSRGPFTDCDACPLMVAVSAGGFQMGSDENRPDEKPSHQVDIGSGFAIGVYEVMTGEWQACVRDGGCDHVPVKPGDDRLPMSNVSWDDAQQYAGWLREKTGVEYRLPSESEWEYAARGGMSTVYWWGDEAGEGNANCKDCGSEWDGKSPAPVGSFKPNPFGLYDVHGNLWEWTLDCYNRSYKGAPTDGSASSTGDCIARVLRGGSWNLDAEYMRSSRRNHYDRDVRYYVHGFRVLRSLP